MKDKDLDILLAEYRNKQPSDIQMQKWKRVVRRELGVAKAPKKQIWMQLVAASIIGFFVGALAFKTTTTEHPFQKLAQHDNDNATVEYVYINSN